jgi:NADH dehydrogenase/NADH:ubiquinone oxidoreductase subunit G
MCTFYYEISGNFDFGVIGRGSSMEIGTYVNKYINDELLGILLIYVLLVL